MHICDAFGVIDMRVGRILKIDEFSRANQELYKIKVDFGPEIGCKWSAMEAKKYYSKEELLSSLVIGVVNIGPKNIAGFISEVLILGTRSEDDGLSLIVPNRSAKLGAKIY
jgi:tRNA-binding protein